MHALRLANESPSPKEFKTFKLPAWTNSNLARVDMSFEEENGLTFMQEHRRKQANQFAQGLRQTPVGLVHLEATSGALAGEINWSSVSPQLMCVLLAQGKIILPFIFHTLVPSQHICWAGTIGLSQWLVANALAHYIRDGALVDFLRDV